MYRNVAAICVGISLFILCSIINRDATIAALLFIVILMRVKNIIETHELAYVGIVTIVLCETASLMSYWVVVAIAIIGLILCCFAVMQRYREKLQAEQDQLVWKRWLEWEMNKDE